MRSIFFCCLLFILITCIDRADKSKSVMPDDSVHVPKLNQIDKGGGALALVIGQGEYVDIPDLDFAESDADSVRYIFNQLHIPNVGRNNIDKAEFLELLGEWSDRLKNYSVGIVYYSGHGVEVDGVNYLIPTDLPDDIQARIEDGAISLDTILNIMARSQTKMNLIFLDACRNNPFKTKAIFGGGLGVQFIPSGTFIGFSASPGKTSYDRGVTNSVYTEGILRNIRIKDRTLDQVFNNVNAYVRDNTGGKQIPFKHSSLDADFYFDRSSKLPQIPADQEYKNIYSDRIKSLFPDIPLGSSIGDVLAFEFGEPSRNAFNYESMPIARECTNNEIRYYWRKLTETTRFEKLKNYLAAKGLDQFVKEESSIFYTFKDGRLFRLAVNLSYTDQRFHNKLMGTLGITDEKYRSKFFHHKDNFYTTMNRDPSYSVTSLFLGASGSFTYCNNDWFSTMDTLIKK